jgi:hypothetical protein
VVIEDDEPETDAKVEVETASGDDSGSVGRDSSPRTIHSTQDPISELSKPIDLPSPERWHNKDSCIVDEELLSSPGLGEQEGWISTPLN